MEVKVRMIGRSGTDPGSIAQIDCKYRVHHQQLVNLFKPWRYPPRRKRIYTSATDVWYLIDTANVYIKNPGIITLSCPYFISPSTRFARPVEDCIQVVWDSRIPRSVGQSHWNQDSAEELREGLEDPLGVSLASKNKLALSPSIPPESKGIHHEVKASERTLRPGQLFDFFLSSNSPRILSRNCKIWDPSQWLRKENIVLSTRQKGWRPILIMDLM